MNCFSLRTMVFIVLVFPGWTSPVLADDLVIGLSPHQDPQSAKAQVKTVLQFLAERVEPGDSALLLDAWHIRSLGSFTVPNQSVYRSPKFKLQINRPVVGALLKFAKQSRVPHGTEEPSVVGAVRLPQALRFVGENYPVTEDTDVIILGNPLFDDPKEPGFTMARHHIPGDGHLSRSRRVTPFGIKGQDSVLAKRRVHLGFPDDRWRQDDHHEFHVKRWWSLFIAGQGGVLTTFTPDLPTLFQRVKTRAPVPRHTYTVERSDKLEMIRLRPTAVEQSLAIYERPVSTAPLALALVHRAPDVEIGLTWDCGACDLDLYARSGSAAEPLSYRHTRSPEGRFWKDWMRSPLGNAYETVSYAVPVDLATLFLAANFYGGSAPQGVTGEVRITVGEHTYAQPFHIPAREGNGGDQRRETLDSGRAATPHWLVINPLAVIGVAQPAPSMAQQ